MVQKATGGLQTRQHSPKRPIRQRESPKWMTGAHLPRSQSGGAEGIRTPDPHNAIVVLYQLSYDPVPIDGTLCFRLWESQSDFLAVSSARLIPIAGFPGPFCYNLL